MSPQEAADYIGIALGTLRNWTSAEFVPFAKKGRVVRYHRDVIDAWLLGTDVSNSPIRKCPLDETDFK
jgi:excisionase family DNA binding protein